jgi:hypothetical protein
MMGFLSVLLMLAIISGIIFIPFYINKFFIFVLDKINKTNVPTPKYNKFKGWLFGIMIICLFLLGIIIGICLSDFIIIPFYNICFDIVYKIFNRG